MHLKMLIRLPNFLCFDTVAVNVSSDLCGVTRDFFPQLR